MDKQHIGEFGLIEKIKKSFASLVPESMEGIGDDCAVIPLCERRSLLATTDMLVERVHFLRDKTPARELGKKALTVNLSDVAAMGGTPVASFLSISLPEDATGRWADEFITGYKEISERYAVPLLGGDTTSSRDGIVINITVLGEADNVNIKRRSGARPGDLLCVTGTLGDSAAGLQVLLAGGPANDDEKKLVQIHNNPPGNVNEGIWLGRQRSVTAMMDVSDGIASDISHILKASGAGAAVELASIPVSNPMRIVCEHRGWDCEKLAATGGEDFSLLFAVEADSIKELKERFNSEFKTGITVIGKITAASGIKWLRKNKHIEVDYSGYAHF